MLLACPMCRYPLGSGGKRVAIRSPHLPERRSRSTMVRMKLAVVGPSEEISRMGHIDRERLENRKLYRNRRFKWLLLYSKNDCTAFSHRFRQSAGTGASGH